MDRMEKNQFNKTPQELKNIQIDHIGENTWGGIEQQNQYNEQNMKIHPRLQLIRKTQNCKHDNIKTQKITNMLLQGYTQKDAENALKSLKNKARGTDGIPAETCKAIKTWTTDP